MASTHPQSISLPPRPTFSSFGGSSSQLSSSTSSLSSPNGLPSPSVHSPSGHTPKGGILLSPRSGQPSTLPKITAPVGATTPPAVPPTPSKITFAPLPPVAPEHELRRRNSITLGVAARSQLLKSQGVHGKKKNPDGVHYVSMTDEEWEAYKLKFAQQQGTVHEVPDLGTLAYRGGKKLFSKIRSLSSSSSASSSASHSTSAASPSPSPPSSINLPPQPSPPNELVRPTLESPYHSHTPRSGSPPPQTLHPLPPPPAPPLLRHGSDTNSSPPDSSYSGSIAEEDEDEEEEDDAELSAAEMRLRARLAAVGGGGGGGGGSGDATPRRRESYPDLKRLSVDDAEGLGGRGHDEYVLGFEKLQTGHLEDVESWRRERERREQGGGGVVDLGEDGAAGRR